MRKRLESFKICFRAGVRNKDCIRISIRYRRTVYIYIDKMSIFVYL